MACGRSRAWCQWTSGPTTRTMPVDVRCIHGACQGPARTRGGLFASPAAHTRRLQLAQALAHRSRCLECCQLSSGQMRKPAGAVTLTHHVYWLLWQCRWRVRAAARRVRILPGASHKHTPSSHPRPRRLLLGPTATRPRRRAAPRPAPTRPLALRAPRQVRRGHSRLRARHVQARAASGGGGAEAAHQPTPPPLTSRLPTSQQGGGPARRTDGWRVGGAAQP